ncbi:hypothetical protein [Sinorhizobium meliloti]|uniref:hypothetical protein n=1 Tax=Rhizobium meliloti TaxID=382 RepID=UPI0020C174EF|nr:hypothetical protein [Sinorhizobium meliloti]
MLLGELSREVLNRWQDRMPGFGNVAKAVFGAVLLVIGIAIVAGVDKQLEAALVEASRPGEPDHAFLPPSGTTVMPVRLSAPVAGFAG